MTMPSIEFQQPQWLWIGAIACVALAGAMLRASRLARRALTVFAGAKAISGNK